MTEGQKWTYITKLHHPNLSQFTDTTVGSFGLEEELSQRHLFTSEEFPHVAEGYECSAPLNQPEPLKKWNIKSLLVTRIKKPDLQFYYKY